MFEGRTVLFEYFLTHEDVFMLFQRHVLDMKQLSKEETRLLEWAKKFRDDVGRVPTAREVALHSGRVYVDQSSGIEDTVLHREFVDFIRNERMRDFIIDTSDKIDRGRMKPEDLYTHVKKIVDEFAVIEKRFTPFENLVPSVIEGILDPDQGDPVPTGIRGLDAILGGGVRRGEFCCSIAPSGFGKSTWLLNQAYGALLARKKVLFLTLELSEEVIASRIFRRITKMTRKQIRGDLDKAKNVGELFLEISSSFAVAYSKARTLTVSELGVLVDRFIKLYGGLDLLVIDYFDRLRVSAKDMRLGFGYLVDDLRDMAADKYVAIASATQANKASLSAQVVTEEHVSESYKKVESSDIVISLNRSQNDEKRNAGRIVILKNREHGGRGAQVPVRIDWGKSLIEDFPTRTGSGD